MLPRKHVVIIIIVIIVGFSATVAFRVLHPGSGPIMQTGSSTTPQQTTSTTSTGGACLQDNEYADYPLDPQYASSTLTPKFPLVISVRDKSTKQERFKFQIDDIPPQHYHPFELHRCNVYAIREISSDDIELWQYNYHGDGKKILVFHDTKTVSYSYDFSIDPNENYVILERSYLGKPDYALVIKDLKTMQDVFVLKLSDLIKQYSPDIAGSFDLGPWSDDGKYIFSDIYDGARETAYYRLEVGTWKLDVYLSPPEILAGVERASDVQNGYIGYLAYVDIPTFVGIQQVEDQIIQQAIREGKDKNLFVYNFATKQTIKVATTTPNKRFNLEWISSTTLQYSLPSGATTTYMVPQ